MKNEVTQATQKKDLSNLRQNFSAAIQSEKIQDLIFNTLGDKVRAQKFIAAISSVVATNPALQECDSYTVINSALLGEAMQLPPSPQLGYYYMLPFKDNNNNRKVATFVMGYKGYIQLAVRSGYYKFINASEVVQGEYLGRDPLTREPRFAFFEKDEQREGREIIGYMAIIQLVSGFTKAIYWDYNKMLKHAHTYSAAFNKNSYKNLQEGKVPQKDMCKYSSFWYKSFDDMAMKTMLRQIISKWGIMSVEMVQAFENDTSYTDADGRTYFDNKQVVNQVQKDVEENTGKVELPFEELEQEEDLDSQAENLFNQSEEEPAFMKEV
jgi:recombination protein RecT